jgi:hypothetical protein
MSIENTYTEQVTRTGRMIKIKEHFVAKQKEKSFY